MQLAILKPSTTVRTMQHTSQFTDRTRRRRAVSDRSIRYVHYAPQSVRRSDLVLVTVHGISRNADEHAAAFQSIADRLGCHLIAPQFDRDSFRDFQLLGLSGRGRRADHALEAALADLRRFGVDADARLVLTGYSGGAQFAHRYAMAHPRRVALLLIAAAGWYTMPDAELPFPRGCGLGADAGTTLDPAALLRLPVLVTVGDGDIERDPGLRCDAWIDRDQGLTRVERARAWVTRLASEARRRDLTPRCRLELVAGAGHDFTAMVAAGMIRRFQVFLDEHAAALDAPSFRSAQ
jgi:pimeloyl-ACP methyl ester carboxylesterase